MQYHLNGFRPGDPAQSLQQPGETDAAGVDVLIVGCGPAGLTLAAQLAGVGGISTKIIDRKPGPLKIGQADGIACRSVEMFAAFGFAHKVIAEGYRVNEVAFWRSEHGTGLEQVRRIQDVEDDLSEMPHIILSQARVHDFFLEVMANGPRRLTPEYDCALVSLIHTDDPTHPITATISSGGENNTVRAKYVVGCDGARSVVRREIGVALQGEAGRQLWGVMDVLAVTDFPDIRLKAAVQSADQGSLLIIPREGGYLVRMYIELDALAPGERVADRAVTAEMLIDKARAILAPFTLDVKDVAWWSAYEIGQRVCDRFDDVPDDHRGQQVPRIFIAGDACHTHSPKAGQGMNVSMADTFNLGWKLAAVLRGQAIPALLDTYTLERRAKAKELIDFDKDMARLFSAKPENPEQTAQFQRYFERHARYTAGVATRYDPSLITGAAHHQALASGLGVGMRFHSAPVIRLGDGKPMHLGHAFGADGRWRLVAFGGAGDIGQAGGRLNALCQYLSDGPLARHTPKGADCDSVLDLRAVLQGDHRDMSICDVPLLLRPQKGRYGLVDYEKVFCPDLKTGPDIFDHRGINRDHGALVILRPDQFVAQVLPLDAFADITAFFHGFMVP